MSKPSDPYAHPKRVCPRCQDVYDGRRKLVTCTRDQPMAPCDAFGDKIKFVTVNYGNGPRDGCCAGRNKEHIYGPKEWVIEDFQG